MREPLATLDPMAETPDEEMDVKVELWVYDLSGGLARQVSMAFLGTQIDAIYHTSIAMRDMEYVYDGGLKVIKPDKVARPPLQIVNLGITNLPMDIIEEYLESLKDIYTVEAYDIWSHNCNNFSNDFSMFLVGRGIPEHIANLPATVLNTPFGRALAPQINQVVEQRRTNGLLGLAPTPLTNGSSSHGIHQHSNFSKTATTVLELDKLLKAASNTCAVVFFTSQTCGPCKPLYPIYLELANEARHKASLISVDISAAYDVGLKYDVRATPTFITFLHGDQMSRWSGADASKLRNNVKMLINMAFPPHPHDSLPLPALRGASTKPVTFSKLPPLDKFKAKMGPSADDPAVTGVLHFVSARATDGAAEASLPDLDAFSSFLRNAPAKLPTEIMFTIVDLMRIGMVDPRFSGYFAEEKGHKTVAPLLNYVNSLKDCPYPLRLVALHLGCNLFTSSLYPAHILKCPELTDPVGQLIATSLLDDKNHNVRVAAASLAFNLAVANYNMRVDAGVDSLPEGDQVELAASLLEAIRAEELSAEAVKGSLLALGYFALNVPEDSELVDLLKTMDAQGMVLEKKKLFPKEPLVDDVGESLLKSIASWT